MRKRVALCVLPSGAYGVDLPTYHMVPGSFRPVTALLLGADGVPVAAKPADVLALKPTVLCELPDDWFDKKGAFIGADALRAMYAGTRFGDKSYTPPAMV